MEIKPIHTAQDYDAALGRIESLWGAAPGTPHGDELDVLVTLAEAYEREHFPIDLPDPIEAIKFRLEQEGKDYRALIGVIGQRTRVYEVMRKARPLSLRMIRSLHSKLSIPAQVLIQSAPTSKRTRPASRQTRTRRTVARSSPRQRRA
jgi:HTH-type transcriptional regulator/antitoxin HigA